MNGLEKLKKENITLGQPYRRDDSRCPRHTAVPALQWGEHSFSFQPGSQFGSGNQGVHVQLPLTPYRRLAKSPLIFL